MKLTAAETRYNTIPRWHWYPGNSRILKDCPFLWSYQLFLLIGQSLKNKICLNIIKRGSLEVSLRLPRGWIEYNLVHVLWYVILGWYHDILGWKFIMIFLSFFVKFILRQIQDWKGWAISLKKNLQQLVLFFYSAERKK